MKKVILGLAVILISLNACKKVEVQLPEPSNLTQQLNLLNEKYSQYQSTNYKKTDWNWDRDLGGAGLGFAVGSLTTTPIGGAFCAIAWGIGCSALKKPAPTNPLNYITNNGNWIFTGAHWYNSTLFYDFDNFNAYREFGVKHNIALDYIQNRSTKQDLFNGIEGYFQFLNDSLGGTYDLVGLDSMRLKFYTTWDITDAGFTTDTNSVKDFYSSAVSNSLIPSDSTIVLNASKQYAKILYKDLSDSLVNDYTKNFCITVTNSGITSAQKAAILQIISLSLHSYAYWKS